MPYRLAIPQYIKIYSHEQIYLPVTRYRSLHTDTVTHFVRTVSAAWRYPNIKQNLLYIKSIFFASLFAKKYAFLFNN